MTENNNEMIEGFCSRYGVDVISGEDCRHNWNALIRVIDKIERLHPLDSHAFVVIIHTEYVRIEKHYLVTKEVEICVNVKDASGDKIAATYSAVVQFINYLNQKG